MMFCPDCSTNLDNVPVDEPCPTCGSGRRSATVTPEPAGVVALAGELSLLVTKGDARPWGEKWREVLHHLGAIQEAYKTDARHLGNAEVDRRVIAFFVECDHLRDWLQKDAASGVTEAQVYQHFSGSAPLKTCNAICNTHKHHTRSSNTMARIRDTSVAPTGARVTIEVDWAQPTATTVDALDLANDCVASWRKFFNDHGITEPN